MNLFCAINDHLWVTKPLIGLSLCANCGKLREEIQEPTLYLTT